MKKLLAILLSMLMLCTMIPFAAVSAADEPTIVVFTEEEVYNAGAEEVAVIVSLNNNPGLISAKVEILYDESVMELICIDDLNEIYPSGTWGNRKNLSSCTYGPPGDCLMNFCNGTSTTNITDEEFFVAYFNIKEDAITGTYPLTIKYKEADFFNVDGDVIPFGKEDGTITINGRDPEPEQPACEHEYEYDCSTNCSKCGEETRPDAVHQYNYACDTNCNECGEKTNPRAKHNVTHVEAKPAGSCIDFGNIEYWYCDACGMAWLDEYCRQNTNLKAVMTSAPCVSNTEFACQNGACITCGMTVASDVPHSYDHNYDVDCNVCGEIRVIVDSIITGNETSIRENDAGEGLAFKFNVDANNTVLNSYYKLNEETEEEGDIIPSVWKIDYSKCTVTLDPIGTCKLVSMGALVDNGIKSISVYARYVNCVENYYTIRILNIPDNHLDTELTATPFYIYENAEGNQFIVYGNSVTASYNGVLNTVA